MHNRPATTATTATSSIGSVRPQEATAPVPRPTEDDESNETETPIGDIEGSTSKESRLILVSRNAFFFFSFF